MGLRFEPYNPMLSYRVGGYVDLPAAAWPLPPEFPFTLRAGRSWNVSVKFCGPGSLEGVPPPTSPVQGIRSWVSTPRPRVSTDRKRLGPSFGRVWPHPPPHRAPPAGLLR